MQYSYVSTWPMFQLDICFKNVHKKGFEEVNCTQDIFSCELINKLLVLSGKYCRMYIISKNINKEFMSKIIIVILKVVITVTVIMS